MDLKYLPDGRAVFVERRLKGLAGGGFLVLDAYEHPESGDPYPAPGPPYLVSAVYDVAPVAKRSKEIVELEARIAVLRTEEAQARRARDDVTAAHEARMAKLQRYEALRHLEDFLEGRIACYAKMEYGRPQILDAPAVYRNEYHRAQSTKLLTLFGDAGGNLAWRLNDYRDGSGGWEEVWPCASRQEALDLLQRKVDEACEILPDGTWGRGVNIAETQALGLIVPEAYIAHQRAEARRRRLSKIQELRSEIAKLEAEDV